MSILQNSGQNFWFCVFFLRTMVSVNPDNGRQVIAKAPIAFGKVSLKGVMQWYKQLVAF
jgi:hypothetical protein